MSDLVTPGFLTGLALSSCGAHQGSEAASQPSVLVVVLDTVRADYCSAYGQPLATTPNLDVLATQGILFEDVTSPGSWTWPTHASLFTGLAPWEHGAHHLSAAQGAGEPESNDESATVTRLRESIPTLAERFQDAGYRTLSYSANLWLDADLGLMRGFDEAQAESISCGSLVDRLELELAVPSEAPRFVFVNFLNAHAPYGFAPVPWMEKHRAMAPGPEPSWKEPWVDQSKQGIWQFNPFVRTSDDRSLLTEYLSGERRMPPELLQLARESYASEVAAADRCLGMAVRAFSQAEGSDVVVAVTSDHGEYLGEHDLLEHSYGAHTMVNRVPLVLLAPGRLPEGQRIDVPVQLQDLTGTLLRLAGLPALGETLDGALSGEERQEPLLSKVYAHPAQAEFGERFTHDWKLFRDDGWALMLSGSGQAELYDLAQDPSMLQDVAERQPVHLQAMLEQAGTAFVERHQSSPLTLSDEQTQALQVLGYLDP